ncbi:MAG: hypothetical protein ACO4CT_15920, partial [Planctomycetota bacterium]
MTEPRPDEAKARQAVEAAIAAQAARPEDAASHEGVVRARLEHADTLLELGQIEQAGAEADAGGGAA